MSIREVRQALGSWAVKLKEDTPLELIADIEQNKFGHICIVPGRINPKLYNDGLLARARYVGVYRSTFKQSDDTIEIKGSGMAFWLGDEDDKGDVFETAVELTTETFADTIRALLPPNGAVIEGNLYSIPGGGTYTGRHQWETPRKAITYVTDTYSSGDNIVEWRVNGNGTLDAGPIEELYVTTPKAILVKRDTGRDMRLLGVRADMSMDNDVEDLTTRIVLLAQGEGTTISTGTADADPTGFTDLFGNPLVQTRLVSESETSSGNASTRAQLQLKRWSAPRQAIQIRTDEFDVKGDFVVGDYIYVFDPEAGFYDFSNEVYWRGQPINPIALRVTEMDWNIRPNWTVAFRKNNGEWLDLSQYYKSDAGGTTIAVGDYRRTLAGNNYEDLGFRPNLPPPGEDETVPAAPTWDEFSTGSYQPETGDWTKAAVYASWNQPLNGDGSVITDGGHYEIRYRINSYIGYRVRWGQLEGAGYRWGQLESNRWGAPISDPVQASQEWNVVYVGWGQTQILIQELTPGVEYEFQIRAVDSAIPPNRGPWSTSEFVVASEDLFAPSTPAVPVVASSRIAIQVVHTLGKASGGTYNLQPDLVYFSVHVGGSESFLADDSNEVGKLIANSGMIQAQIPAVGTFQIEQVDGVYVKVIAVDRAGNKSNPSEGVQATVELIDDAHISDLTVSKITAGTIMANWIMAGSIKTADIGARVEIDADGVRAYNSAGENTADINSDGSVSLVGSLKTEVDGKGIEIRPGSVPDMVFRTDSEADPTHARLYSLTFDSGTAVQLGIEDAGSNEVEGGKLLLFEFGAILSYQLQHSGGGEQYIGVDWPFSDMIYVRGAMPYGFFNTDAMWYANREVVGAGFGGVIVAYGETMTERIVPTYSLTSAADVYHYLTAISQTGFTLSWSGAAAHTAYVHVVRAVAV